MNVPRILPLLIAGLVALVSPESRLEAEVLVLKNGNRIEGKVDKNESTEEYYVLNIEGGGLLRVSKADVKEVESSKTEKKGDAPEKTEDGGLRIPTSHSVTLKNGRKVRGNLISDAKADPLVMEFGDLGRLSIEQRRVEKVEASAGEIIIPPEPPEPPTPKESPEPPETTKTSKAPAEPREEDLALQDPALEAEIVFNVQELARWRPRNRTRAEETLRRLGKAAVPYLAPAARNPFELTRRAALRLVRDAGSDDGVPLAINALLDQDAEVRIYALASLQKLTGESLGYRPRASVSSRRRAHGRWLEYYAENFHEENAPGN